MSQLVDDLVEQVRSQLDENNTENITDSHILQALNRAQRKAANITARKFEDLFWDSTTVTTVGGQREYEIPVEAFGRRIEKVEVQQGQVAWEVRRISNHNRTQYITASQVQRPYYYTLVKNKIQLYPKPSGGLTITIHFTRQPESLVVQQGRIVSVNKGNNYVLVDSIGDGLSTVTSGFASFINIVDFNTGDVKRTLQILSLDETTGQIKFRSTPTRARVLNKSIDSSIADVTFSDGDAADPNIEEDDYICLVTGTCVPELPGAYSDYLIQHAVVSIRRRLGEPLDADVAELKDLEKELERMWVGREQSNRIRKANRSFSSGLGGNLRRLLS